MNEYTIAVDMVVKAKDVAEAKKLVEAAVKKTELLCFVSEEVRSEED